MKKQGKRRIALAAAAMLLMAGSIPVPAQEAGGQAKSLAAEYLKARLEAQCPMASYETENPLLAVSSYTYDNAIAAMALMSEGESDTAFTILNALSEGMDHDAEFQDRFRNAYMSGKATDLPGYWDDEKATWIQDAYQVGSSTKSSCAAAVALLQYDQKTGTDEFLDTAVRAVDWVINNCTDQNSGFTSGYTGWLNAGEFTDLTYKTTADNLWMAAACEMLAAATGWDKYSEAAQSARQFVTEDMYSAGDSRFFEGTKEDGITPVTGLILTEPQALAVLCLDDDSGLDNLDSCRAQDGGYAYDNSNTEASWLEGSGMAALAFSRIGEEETASQILAAMEQMQLPSGAFLQAEAEVTTGEADMVLHDWPCVAACAWYILAANSSNPLMAG